MALTLAFDVYGTLIDTHGVTQALNAHLGNQARAFSTAWRNKQLEYSFRRGLMQDYRTFEVCTREALAYTCSTFNLALDVEDVEALLAVYRALPAFPDAKTGLARARDAGFRLFAFSNGTAEAVDTLLRQAELRDFFLDVVSVDEVRSFKPDPGVYAHFSAGPASQAPRRGWFPAIPSTFLVPCRPACDPHGSGARRKQSSIPGAYHRP